MGQPACYGLNLFLEWLGLLSPPPGLEQIDSPGRSEMSTPPDKSFETEVEMDGKAIAISTRAGVIVRKSSIRVRCIKYLFKILTARYLSPFLCSFPTSLVTKGSLLHCWPKPSYCTCTSLTQGSWKHRSSAWLAELKESCFKESPFGFLFCPTKAFQLENGRKPAMLLWLS